MWVPAAAELSALIVGERPVAPVYVDGSKTVTLKGDRIAEEFQQLVEQYVARSYPPRAATRGGGA